jgi:hypothetical protein
MRPVFIAEIEFPPHPNPLPSGERERGMDNVYFIYVL